MQVMALFERGGLKDQKLNAKHLIAKPEFKQQYLTPLRSLPTGNQIAILQKVMHKQASLNELKVLARNAKQLCTLKTLFIRLTNTSNWEEASQKYPYQATVICPNLFLSPSKTSAIMWLLPAATQLPQPVTTSTIITLMEDQHCLQQSSHARLQTFLGV